MNHAVNSKNIQFDARAQMHHSILGAFIVRVHWYVVHVEGSVDGLYRHTYNTVLNVEC